jgi:hypothetical protein
MFIFRSHVHICGLHLDRGDDLIYPSTLARALQISLKTRIWRHIVFLSKLRDRDCVVEILIHHLSLGLSLLFSSRPFSAFR